MKNKFVMTLCVMLGLICGIGFTGIVQYKSIENKPIINKGTEDTVKIDANYRTFSEVLANNKDVFRNELYIKIYNRLNNVSVSIYQGEYDVPKDITLDELIESLSNGTYNSSIRKVTIPEGYTVEKIALALENNDVISTEEFLKACKSYELPSYIKKVPGRRYALEGFLFPDTYHFQKGMSGNDIIKMMLNRFEQVIKNIEDKHNIKIKDSDLDSIITKASVIEREVSKVDEKPLVSSVIDNRLDNGMKLQIDATVLYALGEHKDRVLYSDLKIASPYNTYYTKGLPLGPISNPGSDSIEAALFPSDTDYIYYLTKDGTNHKFFKEYKDFLAYKNSK